jgi:hypothetical protein
VPEELVDVLEGEALGEQERRRGAAEVMEGSALS